MNRQGFDKGAPKLKPQKIEHLVVRKLTIEDDAGVERIGAEVSADGVAIFGLADALGVEKVTVRVRADGAAALMVMNDAGDVAACVGINNDSGYLSVLGEDGKLSSAATRFSYSKAAPISTAPNVIEHLRCKSIQVVDAQDKSRIRISAAAFTMSDAAGADRVVLTATGKNSIFMLCDAAGEPRAIVGIGENGEPMIGSMDKAGRVTQSIPAVKE